MSVSEKIKQPKKSIFEDYLNDINNPKVVISKNNTNSENTVNENALKENIIFVNNYTINVQNNNYINNGLIEKENKFLVKKESDIKVNNFARR